MSLITDKEILRQFVRINFINDVSSLPDFDLAAARYLIPATGQDMYDDIVANVNEVAYEDVVKLSRAVIGPLGYLMELATIQTQLTDAGLRSISTEHSAAAHRWEYNEVKDHLEDKGAYALEALIKYLFELQYPLWTASDEYKELNKLIFKTGDEFNKYYTLHHPHRSFWELRPWMMEVQDLYINSTIGEDFFMEMRDKVNPSELEKKVIILVKKAVAQYTIVAAIEKGLLKKTVKGFTVMIASGNADSSNAGDTAATDNALDMTYKSCTRTGDSYLVQLKELLDKNATAEILTTYFESSYYTNPTTIVCDRNKSRKIFGL